MELALPSCFHSPPQGTGPLGDSYPRHGVKNEGTGGQKVTRDQNASLLAPSVFRNATSPLPVFAFIICLFSGLPVHNIPFFSHNQCKWSEIQALGHCGIWGKALVGTDCCEPDVEKGSLQTLGPSPVCIKGRGAPSPVATDHSGSCCLTCLVCSLCP